MRLDIRGSIFRILRVTLVVLVLIGAAVWIRDLLTSVKSEQAVINAEIIQLRTPIAGMIEIAEVRPGMLLKKGDLLFKVKNARYGDQTSAAQATGMANLVETVRGEVMGAKQELELAQLNVERDRKLYKSDLIARMILENSETRVTMAKKLLEEKNEQLARSEVRAQEVSEQVDMQKESEVTMPADGLVWSIGGKTGEQADANRLVMEVINPSHIWVDAFFSERHTNKLKPGLPAVITSLDSKNQWGGELESIRAGVGRMAYDTTVAVPPPEMAKRLIAVRVEANWQQPFSAVEFFGVGRSVKVSFLTSEGRATVGDRLKEKWKRAFSGTTAAKK